MSYTALQTIPPKNVPPEISFRSLIEAARVACAALAMTLALAGCGDKDEKASAPAGAQSVIPQSGIGRIEALEGDVRLFGARGEERAQAGVLIEQGETVRTLANAWALLVMSDGASITLRADSELRFDDYRYAAEGEPQQNSAAMSLVRGALRSITGLIGQTHPGGYRIATPTATIGIRGTDHEPAYYPPPAPGQKAEYPPGTYDKVNQGETVIRRASGEVPVRRGETAYAPPEVSVRPQILARAPAFYQRHAEVDRRAIDRRAQFHRAYTREYEQRQQERRQRGEAQKKAQDERKDKRDQQRGEREEAQKKREAERKGKQDERNKGEVLRQDERQREREKQQDAQKKKQAEQKKAREERRQERQSKGDPRAEDQKQRRQRADEQREQQRAREERAGQQREAQQRSREQQQEERMQRQQSQAQERARQQQERAGRQQQQEQERGARQQRER